MIDVSLTEAVTRIRTGAVTATELVEASLGQIAATDETIGAFASVQADAARQRARNLDDVPAVGPLHGIPIALKDLIWTEGVPAVANCGALADFIPNTTATVAQRLHDAGAVLIGKTNTHELAFGVSCPASRNPWNPERMTGGSSGGSAAALAARQVFGAVGTDTGGSVRIPSNYCGTTGIKTTRDLVPRDGVHLISETYDTVGPMARSAADCRVLLEVMAGNGSPLLPEQPPHGLTLGLPDAAFFAQFDTDDEVLSTLHQAVEDLASIVREVKRVTLPDPVPHATIGSTIVFREAARLTAQMRAGGGDRMGDEVRSILEMGDAVTDAELAEAEAVRATFERDMTAVFTRQGVDVFIMPVTPNQVLPHGIDARGGVPLIPATTQFTFPVNGAGLPSIALPGGFAGDGLPIGFQLVGQHLTERTLAQLGVAFQAHTAHHQARPALAG